MGGWLAVQRTQRSWEAVLAQRHRAARLAGTPRTTCKPPPSCLPCRALAATDPPAADSTLAAGEPIEEALKKKFGASAPQLVQRVVDSGRQDGVGFASWKWRASTVKGGRMGQGAA